MTIDSTLINRKQFILKTKRTKNNGALNQCNNKAAFMNLGEKKKKNIQRTVELYDQDRES